MASVRILYLIPSLDRSGGAEQAVAALVGPLGDRGVSLDVVTLKDLPGDASDLVATVTDAGASVSTLSSTTRVAQVRELTSRLRARRPDLVHTTLFDADLVGRVGARRARVPVVSSLVNVAYGPEQRANPALTSWKVEAVRWADALTGVGVRRFHALSPHVAQVMGRRLRIRSDRIDVIPRGRDSAQLGEPDAARRQRVRRSLGIEADAVLVVAAARHEYQKGLDVLVAAWPEVRAAIPGAVLRIGGRSGSQTARLERDVAAQGADSRIELLGRRDDVPDLMVAADVFVVPSRWEGFGSILIEAMALGVPLVASRIDPVTDVVGPDWARLVAPDRPAELAQAIVETTRQPAAEAARRADRARSRFGSSYRIDVVADATVAFYERALRCTRSGH
jgi:glycosyltransferase involved in cell wall biosynthesis